MIDRNFKRTLPVLSGFFVMGFCDVAGIATSYIKNDFSLSETVAGFIPSMVFIWFLLISIPSAMAMNRFGRKKIVQASNLITLAGMLIPFFHYSLFTSMAGFVLLGIGNTMLQVSLNPLLTNVVSEQKLTSMLTTGQLIKAVSSFCGPFIAAFAAGLSGSWQHLFPTFAVITLVSMLWLMFTKIPEETAGTGSSSMRAAFSILKDKTILLLFLGIFFIVGVDVGINTIAPKLLIERAGLDLQKASLGSSVYFLCRTAGALLGSILLARVSDTAYFRLNIILALAAVTAMTSASGTALILALVGAAGFFCSSIFSIIYSMAMKARPEKTNEISGLMIMGVCGGAVIPPLMGMLTDAIGNQNGSVMVIGACLCYLAATSFILGKKQAASR